MDFLRHAGFALAYLDLGSGSFIIQVVIATLLGSAVAIKAFWKQISGFFRKGTPTRADEMIDTDS
jgi:hypothetical protein